MTKFTLGADPEFFLRNRTGNVSAHNLVPGTKRAPHKLARGAAVQADGTALEFNVKPASTPREFQENILDAMEQIRALIPKSYKFDFTPAVFYNKVYFQALPISAKELGCEPDYNGITGGVNPTPTPTGKFETMRTAAGHVHLGFCKDNDITNQSHRWDCMMLARCLDSVFRPLMYNWDTDKNRIQLYGKNSCYRPKPYGVEYRALSVAWLRYPDMYPWVFGVCKSVFEQMQKGKYSYLAIEAEAPPFDYSMCKRELTL